MKKAITIILILTMILSLAACGSRASNASSTKAQAENATIPTEKPVSARDSLNETEKQLFDALIEMAKNFYEPSAVKVLEVGDYENNTKWEGTEYKTTGSDTVVVRLQGENRVGGTLNHYYRVCIKEGANLMERYSTLPLDEFMLKYGGKFGEYVELEDSYKIKNDASGEFDIGKINRALKEYWEEMGF